MKTKINIIANVGGRVAASLMSFVFVPVYIRLMGAESYGLIGFFTSIQAIFFILDAGLSTTLNREMARLSVTHETRNEARDLLRTLEALYWIIGVGIGVALMIAAPFLARHWLKLDRLSYAQATVALELMAFTAILRWPVSIYSGALMGLRRHVPLNLTVVAGGLLQSGGGVLVLLLVDPSVVAFFVWQAIASAVTIAALAVVTWRGVDLPGHAARFSRGALKSVAGFSAGVTGITLLSVVLTQTDKFILSRILPLEEFGYYALAGGIAAIFTTAAGAIYGAIFPSLTHAASEGQTRTLAVIYHNSCQLLSVVIMPAAVTLIMFAPELLDLYLGRSSVVGNTALVLRLMTVGNVFLAIMMPPLGLQLAHGWTRLSLYKNVIAVAVLIPALFFMTSRYGAPGAAVVWVVLTAGYFVGEITVMHRRLLRGEQWRWYLVDVGVPAALSVVLLGGLRLVIGRDGPPLLHLAEMAAVAAAALVLSALALPGTRSVVTGIVGRLRGAAVRS